VVEPEVQTWVTEQPGGAEIMDEYKGTPALDAGLLAVAQAIENTMKYRDTAPYARGLKISVRPLIGRRRIAGRAPDDFHWAVFLQFAV
jgi:hypothetical protein